MNSPHLMRTLVLVPVALLLVAFGCGDGGPTNAGLGAVPGAPTIASLTETDGALIIAFIPPASTGDSPITMYRGTCSGDADIRTNDGTRSPPTVDHPLDGRTYSCSLTAANAAGIGQESSPRTGTPRAP